MSEAERKRILPELSSELLVLYLAWLGIISAGLLVYVSGNLSRELLPPEKIHILVVESQLFFLIFVWPLFLSSSRFLETPDISSDRPYENSFSSLRSPGWIRVQRFGIHATSLMLFSLPVVLLSASFSGISAVRVLKLQVLVLSVIAGSGMVWGFGGRTHRNWVHYFYACLLLVSLVAPILYVLLAELHGISDRWLLFFSPLTAATLYDTNSILPAWLFQSLFFTIGGLTAGMVLSMMHSLLDGRSTDQQLPSSAR